MNVKGDQVLNSNQKVLNTFSLKQGVYLLKIQFQDGSEQIRKRVK